MLQPRYDVPLPRRMQGLPRDDRGWIVPWFVDWRDGRPVFPVMNPVKWKRAVIQRRCWVCGERLGRLFTFVIGPMCSINRITTEPPTHRDCAVYSLKVCPFLANPRMGRVPESKVPGGAITPPAGMHDDRNPGVMLQWTTDDFHTVMMSNGPLIEFEAATSVAWWTQGREATAQEAAEAFEAGSAKLRLLAEAEGADALAEFNVSRDRAVLSLPDPGLIQAAA